MEKHSLCVAISNYIISQIINGLVVCLLLSFASRCCTFNIGRRRINIVKEGDTLVVLDQKFELVIILIFFFLHTIETRKIIRVPGSNKHNDGRERVLTIFSEIGGPEKGRFRCIYDGKIIWTSSLVCLTSETVQGTSLPLQSVDDVHGGDGLPLGVFGVRDGITDYVFQKHLQHTTGFFVDQPRDTFDSATAS